MKRPAALLILTLIISACVTSQKPAPVTHYGAQQGAGSAGIHTVTKGETLYKISKRYNLPMRDIAMANGLQAPFALPPGVRLRLPPPQTYKVKGDDTLYSVSRLFGVNTSEIAALNKLHAPYKLSSGQVLRMPTVTRKNSPPPPVPMAVAVARVEVVEIAPVPAQGQIAREVLAPPANVARGQQQTPYANEIEQSIEHDGPALQEVEVASVKPQEPKSKITAQTPKRSSAKFLTPVDGPIISKYGPKENGLHNDGINIRAAQGSPVVAAENGVVVYAGNELKGSGNLILIRHEGRWMTAYAHMDNIMIRRGDVIKRGQTIGTVGTTGSVDSPQLHFEVRRGTEAINPKQYLEG